MTAAQLRVYARDLNRLAKQERQRADDLAAALHGTIQLLAEVLSLVHPVVFGQAARVHKLVKGVVAELGLEHAWQYEAAALLSQIGCVSLPVETLIGAAEGRQLSELEREMIAAQQGVGRRLLAKVPQFAQIADMVAESDPRAADSENAIGVDPGHGSSTRVGKVDVGTGRLVLELARELDSLLTSGLDFQSAVVSLGSSHRVSERILNAIRGLRCVGSKSRPVCIPIWRLRLEMILDEDIKTKEGVLVVSRGNKVTVTMLERLRNFLTLGKIEDGVRVLAPEDSHRQISPVTLEPRNQQDG